MHIRVKVVPRSSKNQVVGYLADGTLKVKIAAPPEKGKANAELRRFLAAHFGVRRQDVVILSGETSPLKHVCITRPETEP